MINCLGPNEFALFKEQWKKYAESDFPGLDERMKGPMMIFNSIPGVATKFCCSGHSLEEGLKKKSNMTYSRLQRRYVMFVVEDGSRDIFLAFDQFFRYLGKEEWSLCRPTLKTGYSIPSWDTEAIYPHWTFEMGWVYELTEEEKSKERDKTQNELWEKLLRELFLITDPETRREHRDVLAKPLFEQPGLIRKKHNV